MSNDYEYLGDSQMPPPIAPRPPTDAPPELITGLPHTPALKANDDVDLESNRPRGNNNLSFSDGLNPKRSEPSVATTKTSRSSESDEESKKETKKEKEERKPAKCGTCWCIFAAVTIFLAVISLLGLGAFLIMNMDGEVPISEALNGTNETSTSMASFETTTPVSVIIPNKIIPLNTSTVLPLVISTTPLVMKTAESYEDEATTVSSDGTSTESIEITTSSVDTQSTTSLGFHPVDTSSSSSDLSTSTTTTDLTASTEPTLEDALPIEDDTTQSNVAVEVSTPSSAKTTPVSSGSETTNDLNELSTTGSSSATLNVTSTEAPTDELAIPN